MQQIYLTGQRASKMAAWALTALRIKAAGYCLTPLVLDGQTRGKALRLLTVPDEPYHNNVPCMVELSPGKSIVLRDVYNKLAAPALRQAAVAKVPVLLDCITADSLKAAAFAEAVTRCLHGCGLVIAVAADDAVGKLRAMTDEDSQLWLHADETNESEIMRRLQQELTMRL